LGIGESRQKGWEIKMHQGKMLFSPLLLRRGIWLTGEGKAFCGGLGNWREFGWVKGEEGRRLVESMEVDERMGP
jgi:hypothetical protein